VFAPLSCASSVRFSRSHSSPPPSAMLPWSAGAPLGYHSSVHFLLLILVHTETTALSSFYTSWLSSRPIITSIAGHHRSGLPASCRGRSPCMSQQYGHVALDPSHRPPSSGVASSLYISP
jgi:hypothetical protein